MDTPYEVRQDPFLITTDQGMIDLEFVFKYLSENSYWAKGIPRDVVDKSIRNTLCFGVFSEDRQVGFARVITDKATFGYLADVFIEEQFRGKGLSKWLMDAILQHPELQGFRRWILATADAHGLYAQYGFKPLAKPERWMEIHNPTVYQQ